MNPLVSEFVRQAMRWAAVALISLGLPPPVAALIQHPEFVAWASGLVIYALSDTGWAVSYGKRVRDWWRGAA